MKKKTINKNIEPVSFPKLFEWGSRKSNKPVILDYLSKHTEVNMMKSLMPKGLVTHGNMASQIKLNLPDRNMADIIIDGIAAKLNASGDKIVLYINSSGDLYQKGDQEHKHSFKLSSLRFQILRILKDSFVKPEYIRHETDSVSVGSVRKAVNEINSQVKIKLGIENNIIEGKGGSGYRINPKYKLEFI